MELRAEATATAAQSFARLPTPGPGGVLVGTHDRAVEEVHRPVHLPLAICPRAQGRQEARPDAGVAPAIEAARDGVPRAILRWQVAPGSARGQDPEDTVEDASMRVARTANAGLLRWEEGSQLLPLHIGEFMSAHTPQRTPVCGHALVLQLQ